MNDLKKRIDTNMDEDEIKGLIGDPQENENIMLKNQLVCEPEIEKIQQVVTRHIEDVEQLAKQNLETKQELKAVLSQYNEKMDQYEVL